MNQTVTSREEILKVSRDLLMKSGNELNIRTVASASGISIGSVYNYFGSKSELVAATVESIWDDIFEPPRQGEVPDGFSSMIRWLYGRMETGEKKYPGFFSLHAASFFGAEKAMGKERMTRSWQKIQSSLSGALESDPGIRPDAFDEGFTRESFSKFVFSTMLAAILQKDFDCSTLIIVAKRTLY